MAKASIARARHSQSSPGSRSDGALFHPIPDSRQLRSWQSTQRRACLVEQAPRFSLLLLQALDNMRRRLCQKAVIAELAFRRSQSFFELRNILCQPFTLGSDVNSSFIDDRNRKGLRLGCSTKFR